MRTVIIFFVLLLLSPIAGAFDAPACGDPWYYQSNDHVAFWVPDKVQHYYGSFALSKIASDKLGPVKGSLVAFALGFLWEVKDAKTSLGTANGGVVGFSTRDLIADGLGVLSAQLNTDRIRFYTDYSVTDEQLKFNVSVSF